MPSLLSETRFRDVGVTLGLGLLVLLAACSSSNSDLATTDDTSSTTAAPLPDYSAEAMAFEEAPDDASFPDAVDPDYAVGTYGFSRYVWTTGPDGIYPTLIEGPRGEQVRCQDEDLPCSYQDLKALQESGASIPDELAMTDDELDELVGQLDSLNAKISTYRGPDDVCADGYRRSSTQTPNMGIHMVNYSYSADGVFVPDEPEMVLLAMDGGETVPQSQIGQCVDGAWTGDPAMQVVGAVYTTTLTPEHPDGFAGRLDNWHVHYNTCAGGDTENRAIADPAACAANGGTFAEVLPTWMMHAYVAPDFDSQQGVFAMFNESVWPLGANAGERTSPVDLGPGAQLSPINNFNFGTIEVDAGDEVFFSNSDSVPHTVTAGLPSAPSGDFDSGVFGSGDVYAQTFDEAGEYGIFCVLHPQMTGTVVVNN